MEQQTIGATVCHQPVPPPRKDHIGEKVYAERWHELMSMPPNGWPSSDYDGIPVELVHLADILSPFGIQPTGRAAIVAATLVCWLGCASGRCFLLRLDKFKRALGDDNEASGIAAWAVENRRRYGTNGGRRLIDFLMERFPDGAGVPDYEVMEAVCAWLATHAGAAFVYGCEKEIDRLESWGRVLRRAQHEAQFGRIDIPLEPA